jgi:glycerol-3-phosphate dehydrogenase
MIRDVDRHTAQTFDVLVVGGGIYGLTIACDAAQRGLSVALIEKDDFGSGASFNHLRTIHGGLRYLQTLDLRRARESIRERRTLACIAPHAVRPLPFALPLYRSLMQGKLALRGGFVLDRIVAFDRNARVPPGHRLPGGRVVSRSSAIQRFPGLRRQGLTGAAVWYDYVTTESDRLTFAWALAAAEHGAVLANHVEATARIMDGPRVAGVRAVDAVSGRELEISARVIVNATGGQVDRLRAPLGAGAAPVALMKAMNLVTSRDAGDEALGGRSKSGRTLFLVPWRERALFGTWESPQPCTAEDTGVNERDVAAFVTELNQAFPSLDLKMADITHVHHGLVPAILHPNGRASLQGHEQIRDEIDGMVSVAGTKYTTARAVAERVADTIFGKLQRKPVPCRTAATPLPGGSLRDVSLTIADARREHDEGLPTDTIPHLVAAYGSRYRDVLEIAADRPEWRTRIARDFPVIGAQLVWAARHEMAITLADAMIRRTPLGALGDPGEAAAARAAAIVGAELGWSADQRRREIAAVRGFYGIVKASNT